MARPTRPLISRDAAVVATLEIIDSEGLGGFSLPKLARRLGVSAPSLYHHFTDKNEILSAVVKHIVGSVSHRRCSGRNGDWPEFFVARAVTFRNAMLEHRNAAPILLEHMPSEILVKGAEESAKFLTDSGIPVGLQAEILDGVETLVLGSILSETSAKPRTSALAGVDTRSRPYLTKALASFDVSGTELYSNRIRTFLRGVVAAEAVNGDIA